MKRIFVKPADVLMFRSSRAFNREGSNIAEKGPITPMTFAGAVKSSILLTADPSLPDNWFELDKYKERKELVGVFGEKGKLRIYGAFFAENDDYTELLPMPDDIVIDEHNGPKKINSPIQIKVGTESYWVIYKFPEKGSGKLFLSSKALHNYLIGNTPAKDDIVKFSKVAAYERRTGIQLKASTKTTEEGMLYITDFLRLVESDNGHGFLVWLNDTSNFVDGYLKVGGEGKVACANKVGDKNIETTDIIKKINETRKMKIYLASPAVFKNADKKNSWCPDMNKIDAFQNIKTELVGASLGKGIYLGGWDYALRRPKPLYKAVDAGSVYYFKIKDGNLSDNIQLPLNISDIEPNSGMGCAFVGVW
ncbi:MAG TPA: type III-B CRISPR module-associated protein Cmr3 [Nitrososphaera sp.]|nr:type III-B CRISPR module-associated protein Cmr3 [Nitrososphaera sp.]